MITMSAYVGQQDSPYEGEPPNVEEEFEEDTGIPEYKITRGFVRDRCMQTSSDNEDSYVDISSDPEDNPTDEIYERRRHRHVASHSHYSRKLLGHGINAVEDVVSAAVDVASIAIRGVVRRAKFFWETTDNGSTPRPLSRSEPNKLINGMYYGTLDEARIDTKRYHNRLCKKSQAKPRLRGSYHVSNRCGRTRALSTIDLHLRRNYEGHACQISNQVLGTRIARNDSGDLIEVREGGDECAFLEARNLEYLAAVKCRGRDKITVLESTKPHTSSRGLFSGIDDFSELEKKDPDIVRDGDTVWLPDRYTKLKNMTELAVMYSTKAKMKERLQERKKKDLERMKREDARERRVKAEISKIRQEEQNRLQVLTENEERLKRELEEWPDAYNGMLGQQEQDSSDTDEPVTEEVRFAKYLWEKQEAREVGEKRMLLRRQYGVDRPRIEMDRDELLDPMKHLCLSERSRKEAQALFSKDRQVRKANERDVFQKLKPVFDAYLKRRLTM
ncbi:uncharacterized protein PV09_01151 [Verruconis gallopava]|uniref:Uncharacterized protein n=1 Tax=Verruconis gallopava TaxID=253628 RepID=A0A0D2ANC1_9PEZI|nr:uncharacterized protein PV09_01151 [Verruconis gallopava]KIW08223.1 hypothetical protein PV09_01151 [Verruconis gallopava]